MIDLTIDGPVAHVVLDNPPAKLNALDETALREMDAALRPRPRHPGPAPWSSSRRGPRVLRHPETSRRRPQRRRRHGLPRWERHPRPSTDGGVPRADLRRGPRRVPRCGTRPAHRHRRRVRRRLREEHPSPFAALGATLDSGGHALFFERLGAHKTLDVIYTGRLMSGTEAVAVGSLLRASSPPRTSSPRPSRPQKRAASGATGAFLASKPTGREASATSAWRCGGLDRRRKCRAGGALATPTTIAEGFAAFQEKRPPQFTGR